MLENMEELPFKAEYAKTGRASCKGCKNKIDQAELRIAKMVQVRQCFILLNKLNYMVGMKWLEPDCAKKITLPNKYLMKNTC